MKDQKGLVISRLTITAFLVAFMFVVAQLSDANKQLAQDKTLRGLHSLSAMQPDQMMDLNSHFSGDPTSVLKEASLAPDLKTISESEYQDLLKNAIQVITTNATQRLSNGATVSSSSFSTESSGPIDSTSVTTSSQGPVMSSAVTSDGKTITPSGAAVMITAGNDGGVTTSYNSSPPSTVPEGVVTVSTDGLAAQYTDAVAVNSDAMATDMAPIMVSGRTSVSLTKASSYVSYTNVHGDTVVIGFDTHNIPVFKSVFKK